MGSCYKNKLQLIAARTLPRVDLPIQSLHPDPFLLSVSPKLYSRSPYPQLLFHSTSQPTLYHANHSQYLRRPVYLNSKWKIPSKRIPETQFEI
ncbi:hypothetical protein P692DRAFT_201031781 [Suillus brevipes Sb2]|nr:hypothetical protein P692DRAFT_201031781 [Suillus brevipes Sb2]